MTFRKSDPSLAVGVVGANGFLAGHLIPALTRAGHASRVFGRTQGPAGDVRPPPSRISDLAGLDVVIHLAGIAHQNATAGDYAAVNVDFAASVATLCRDAGVGRMVFISTAQVHGRHSEEPIGPLSPFNPASEYAASKLRAEQRIRGLLESSATDLCIIRPVLVYAADAKANFQKLRAAARMGLPLPLGCAKARRSMVSIDNLNDAIITLASARRGNAVCLPADPDDLAVSELYAALCRAAGKAHVPLPPAPVWAMRAVMTAAGQSAMFDSLFRKAVVDRRHWADLGWKPGQSIAEGLELAMRDKASSGQEDGVRQEP